MIWCAQCAHVMYSALQEESVTIVCCFEDHVRGPPLQTMTYPEIDLRPLDMAQSESVKQQKVVANSAVLGLA
jgi:hypothetical protein